MVSAVFVVGAMTVFVSAITVGVLHIASTTAFGDDARMVGALHANAAASVQPVMDVHAALGVVNIGARSIGASSDFTAIGGAGGFGSGRCRPGCRSGSSSGTGGSTRSRGGASRSGTTGSSSCGGTACGSCRSSGPCGRSSRSGSGCPAGARCGRAAGSGSGCPAGPGSSCASGLGGCTGWMRGGGRFRCGFGRRSASTLLVAGASDGTCDEEHGERSRTKPELMRFHEISLLDVADFTARECDFQILVEKDLFGADLGGPLRLSKGGDHLIFCLPQIDGLRWRRRLISGRRRRRDGWRRRVGNRCRSGGSLGCGVTGGCGLLPVAGRLLLGVGIVVGRLDLENLTDHGIRLPQGPPSSPFPSEIGSASAL